MVKLYEGCWGKRRNGMIRGPLSFDAENEEFPFKDEDDATYGENGCYYHPFRTSSLDIIEIYPSDPRVKTQEPSPFNLTTREQWRWWFAGQAMQGIISSGAIMTPDNTSLYATTMADALIEQLEKVKEDD